MGTSVTGTGITFPDSTTQTTAATGGITTTSGSAPYYGLRAWVNFNGAGGASINGSVNVSSVSRTNTGTYTINFTTAMPDANYVCSGLAQRNISSGGTDLGIMAYPPGNSATQLSTGSFNVFTCDQSTGRQDSYCVTLMVAR